MIDLFHPAVEQAVNNLYSKNEELGLLSIMPLFDTACRKTWPKEGVGKRFRMGVENTEDIIRFFISQGRMRVNFPYYGSITLPHLIYKYLRNSIIHECKMPNNISFLSENKLIVSKNHVSLPSSISHGLLLAAVGFDCYKNKRNKSNITACITVCGREIRIRDAIGDHDYVRDFIKTC